MDKQQQSQQQNEQTSSTNWPPNASNDANKLRFQQGIPDATPQNRRESFSKLTEQRRRSSTQMEQFQQQYKDKSALRRFLGL
ncbi:predicted protein [Lichtheimia corymbifera JMRC:FSU:9682]|uniref:Uncharacterized protein n=1 Tax=Lichtheimia corymbifera JMRC:FSU:9682 TaxID=1263082 RepID=A0A068RWI2_9FUNG|nr:predicted protein [Lichtheimia corymbifera JMRC:FSU:9682]